MAVSVRMNHRQVGIYSMANPTSMFAEQISVGPLVVTSLMVKSDITVFHHFSVSLPTYVYRQVDTSVFNGLQGAVKCHTHSQLTQHGTIQTCIELPSPLTSFISLEEQGSCAL